MKKFDFYRNCLDLLRIYSAIYVMILHISRYSGFGEAPFELTWINGVVILLFISGYLIPASCERTNNTAQFFKNRAKRLFPPLILSTVVGTAIAAATEGFQLTGTTLKWFFGHFVFIHDMPQPEFISSFGMGGFNGSLWTLIFEVQYYIIAAFTYKFMNKRSVRFWLILLAVLYGVNVVTPYIVPHMSYSVLVVFSHLCIPYLHIFFTGWFIYRFRYDIIPVLVKIKIPVFALLIIWMAISNIFDISIGEYANTVQVFLLCLLSAGVAYSFKLRFKKDITYHLYIWHMIVVNTFVEFGWTGKIGYVAAMYVMSFIVAVASYVVCERIIKLPSAIKSLK